MGAFIYRGPLPPNSPMFRGRRTELNSLLPLCTGAESGYAIVFGGRQTGKTSLMYQLETELAKRSIESCYANYQGTNIKTTDQTLQYLAKCIGESLPELQIEAHVNTLTEMESFLIQVMQHIAPKRLTIILDELGQLPNECLFDLANIIRAIFTNRVRPVYKPLDQLVFVLAGSLELQKLVVAPAKELSPLGNICELIYLPDLSQEEAISLIFDGLTISGLPESQAKKIGEAVYLQVAGHPYLTQRLGGMLAEKWIEKHQISISDLDNALNELGNNDTFFAHLHKKVRDLNLTNTIKILLEQEDVKFTRHDEEMVQLELIGLTSCSQDEKTWVFRNNFFRQEIEIWFGVSLEWRKKTVSTDSAVTKHLKPFTVRIYANAGPPIGVGFLVKDGKIFTCAHVVAASLGILDSQTITPSGEIYLDWLIAPENKQRARVSKWSPVSPGNDIAILELFDAPPANIKEAKLMIEDNVWGHKFRAVGFPEGHDGGVWTSGELRDETADGWLQIDVTSISGHPIQSGFSGSPVWDETLRGVIGMIVAAEADTGKTAFIIPSSLLNKMLG